MKNTMRSLLALLLMGISSMSATIEPGATVGQGSSPTPSHADSTTSEPGSTTLTSITNITISQLINLTQSTSTSNLPGDLQSTAAQTTAVTKTAPVTSTPEAPTENKASGKPTTTTKPMASDQPGTSESNTSHPTAAATKSKASHPTTPASESKASHPTTPASESKASLPTTPTSKSKASLPTTPTSESKASLPTTPTSESKASLPTTSASESKASLPTTSASESTASVPAITVSMTLATNKPTTASESNPSPQSTTTTRSNPSPQPTTATESAMTRPRTTKLPVTSISETLRSAITTQNVVLGSTVPESIPKSTSSSPPSSHREVITPSTDNTQQSTMNPKSSKQVCEHLKLWIIEECNIQRIGNGKYTIQIYSKEIIDEPPSKMEISAFQQSYNTKLIAALVPTFILLFIVVLSSFFLWRRRSYRMNQQQLTEELHTCENGYHDNPTLEVMEVQPEMQEKKVALTKELHDTWIVPLDNLAKVDLLDEEDTHL